MHLAAARLTALYFSFSYWSFGDKLEYKWKKRNMATVIFLLRSYTAAHKTEYTAIILGWIVVVTSSKVTIAGQGLAAVAYYF